MLHRCKVLQYVTPVDNRMIEVEQALTGSTRLKRILFDCCWLVSSVIVIICPDECGSTRVWSNVIALPLSIHDCTSPVHVHVMLCLLNPHDFTSDLA